MAGTKKLHQAVDWRGEVTPSSSAGRSVRRGSHGGNSLAGPQMINQLPYVPEISLKVYTKKTESTSTQKLVHKS